MGRVSYQPSLGGLLLLPAEPAEPLLAKKCEAGCRQGKEEETVSWDM